jgi:hypothetical protein
MPAARLGRRLGERLVLHLALENRAQQRLQPGRGLLGRRAVAEPAERHHPAEAAVVLFQSASEMVADVAKMGPR